MIYCVSFSEFRAYIESLGFELVGGTDADLIFLRTSDNIPLTVHRPNHKGMITEASALNACDDAEIEPPRLDTDWCD